MSFRSRAVAVVLGSLIATGCSLLVNLDELHGSTVDAGGDAPQADAAPEASDAASGLPLLSCTEQANSRFAVTTGSAVISQQMRLGMLPSGSMRIVLVDHPIGSTVVLRAYTVDPKALTSTSTVLQTQATNVFSVLRYQGTSSGFAVLYPQNGMLTVARIPDTANGWNSAVPLAGGNVPITSTFLDATFAPIDPTVDSYYVVMSSISGTTQTLSAGSLSPSTVGAFQAVGTFQVPSGTPAFGFSEPAIGMAQGQAYIMLTAYGASGPVAPGTPVKVVVPGSNDVALTPPGTLNYFPQGFATSIDPTSANAVFLVADLNAGTANYHVGRVPFASLTTFDPASLPKTDVLDGGPLNLEDLFTDRITTHWSVPATTDQLLMTAPTTGIGGPSGGINLAWWDGATGAVRAYQAGASKLFGNVPWVGASDAEFQMIVGNQARLGVAWVSDTQSPSSMPPGDLYFANVTCQ